MKTKTTLTITSCMMAAAMASIAPAAAMDFTPCTASFETPDSFYEALASNGWVESEVTAEVTDQLMWMNATTYFGGDTGGDTFADLLNNARLASQNYDRLKRTETTQTRILSNGTDTMLASWRMPMAHLGEVHCRIALTNATQAAPEIQGFGAYVKVDIAQGNPGLSDYRFQYNMAAVNAEMPDATPPAEVLNIRHEYLVAVN